MSESSNGSSWFERLGRVFSDSPESREELLEVLREAHQQGVIDAESLIMIDGVLEVSEARVRDIMLPRPQIEVIDATESLDEILETMLESSHSRYPVMEDSKVKGVLLAKDVFRAVVKGVLKNKEDLEKLYRAPNFVPESKRLNVLLREFKESRNHMALVVDEYAELAGLVTIEDVLEQIVGSIEDEFDEGEMQTIRRRPNGHFVVDAIVSLEDFNQYFKTDVADDRAETIGGFVALSMGHVPLLNEEIQIGQYRVRVSKGNDRRVQEFEVSELPDNINVLPSAEAVVN